MDYSQFRKVYDATVTEFSDAVLSFPWQNRDAYKGFLSQTYFYVKHSTRLLALAAARCRHDEEALHRRLITHLNEEKGHESLASNDLKSLGDNVENFSECPATSLFYQNQYCLIENYGAAAFFGYVLALEGMAARVGKKIFEIVSGEHGRNASAFCRVHSEDDIEHIEQALKHVEKMGPDQLAWVRSSLEQSCLMYREILKTASQDGCRKNTFLKAG